MEWNASSPPVLMWTDVRLLVALYATALAERHLVGGPFWVLRSYIERIARSDG